MIQLVDEADELSMRALVSETPAAEYEYRQARKHADAIVRHRNGIKQEIEELEVRIDGFLDRMKESAT